MKKPARFTGRTGAIVIGVVVMVSVAAAAMVLAARQPSKPEEIAPVVQSQKATVNPTPRKVTTARVQTKKTKPAKAPANTVTARTSASEPLKATSSPAAVQPVATTAVAESSPVTITGCVEKRGDEFRLKDTTGVDAPKSRSWKSGFLKKGSNSIDLVDERNRVKLSTHVGQRVSVTGMLEDNEMQVRSLQRLGDSCD